eukprot:SAG11_NODE_845_length_6885_cov_6.782346_3_plen_52_part_00
MHVIEEILPAGQGAAVKARAVAGQILEGVQRVVQALTGHESRMHKASSKGG